MLVILGVWWLVTNHIISPIGEFSGPKDAITGVAISPDGEIIVASSSKWIYRWNRSGEKLPKLDSGRHAPATTCLALSPDGQYLVAGNSTFPSVWDFETGKLIWRLPLNRGCHAIAISPDNNLVATTSHARASRNPNPKKKIDPDWVIELWRLDTRKRVGILVGHTQKVRSLAFGPKGECLVSGGDDMVRMWDVQTLTQQAELEGHESGVTCVAISPDGKRIASGGNDKMVRVWDFETKKEILAIKAARSPVLSVVFGRNGNSFFTASLRDFRRLNPGEKKPLPQTLKCWSVATGAELIHFDREDIGVLTLAISADGSYLVAGGDDERVYLFRIP